MSLKFTTSVHLKKGVREANLAPNSVKLVYVKRIENKIKLYFRRGGSPNGKWKVITYRKGQVLIDTHNLMNSVVGQVSGGEMQIINRLSYAAIHNYGGQVQGTHKVKAHTRKIKTAFGKPIKAKTITISQHERNVNYTMPQREFMVMPADAEKMFMEELEQHNEWISKR